MVTRAVLRYIRISPRKFRLIIPLVKGKKPDEAIAILMSVKKGASKYGIDLINSAVNNAKRMQGVDTSSLYISNLIANGGPQLKRFRAASMGRAGMIRKRTSHITLELDYMKPQGEAASGAKKSVKAEAAKPAAHKEAKAKEVKHAPKHKEEKAPKAKAKKGKE